MTICDLIDKIGDRLNRIEHEGNVSFVSILENLPVRKNPDISQIVNNIIPGSVYYVIPDPLIIADGYYWARATSITPWLNPFAPSVGWVPIHIANPNLIQSVFSIPHRVTSEIGQATGPKNIKIV